MAGNWQEKLGSVCVGLRSDLHVTRHGNAGDPTYVVHDPLAFKNHLFRLREYRVMTALVHSRSLRDTFQRLVETKVLRESEKDDYYAFVMLLHKMHLLKLPISDPEILFTRFQWRQQQRRWRLLRFLISYRVPLCDPDRFLGRTIRYVSFLFSRAGLVLWAILGLFALWNLWGKFGLLFEEMADVLEFSNLPSLWIALVVLKALHELGHAYACKRLGGEVPEMGAMIILATPCAYVDASASWKFTSKWRRIAVAMAGMYVESFIASIFAVVWVATQQGLLHEVARNVMLLASASTVLFNANPLMRYDGYFVLTDLVDVPNLRERSVSFLKEGAKRIFLGIGAPPSADGEEHRRLYLGYGIGAVIYKLLLVASIAAMVILRWPLIGVLVAAGFVWSALVVPFWQLLTYLLKDDETASVRGRGRALVISMGAALPLIAFFLPVSFQVVVSGVLEPERSIVARAPADGFVTDVAVGHHGTVRAGDVLLRMDQPQLRLQREQGMEERTAEALLFSAFEVTDLVKAAQHAARLESIDSKLSQLDERLRAMRLTASASGEIGTWQPESLRGRFFREGEPLLEIHSGRYRVHAILSDDEIHLARLRVGDVTDLRWSSEPTARTRAVVEEIRPVVSREEVPPALTMQAGGDVFVRPHLGGGLEADRPYLHVFLKPEERLPQGVAGMTARVRLTGRIETLGAWLRRKVLAFYQTWQIAG